MGLTSHPIHLIKFLADLRKQKGQTQRPTSSDQYVSNDNKVLEQKIECYMFKGKSG